MQWGTKFVRDGGKELGFEIVHTLESGVLVLDLDEKERILDSHGYLDRGCAEKKRVAAGDFARFVTVQDNTTYGLLLQRHARQYHIEVAQGRARNARAAQPVWFWLRGELVGPYRAAFITGRRNRSGRCRGHGNHLRGRGHGDISIRVGMYRHSTVLLCDAGSGHIPI